MCKHETYDNIQCPKLRVHPAPGVHISAAGCTTFGGVHPECARVLSYLSLLHIRRVHGKKPGCTVLGEVHLWVHKIKPLFRTLDEVYPAMKLWVQGSPLISNVD